MGEHSFDIKHNCDIKLLGSHFLVICMLFCYIYMYLKHVFLYFIAILEVRMKLGFYMHNCIVNYIIVWLYYVNFI